MKLDVKDLSFANMKPFDGTMAYAQNKRQQVVMTSQYAAQHPEIHFSSMHPGWADTPGKYCTGWRRQMETFSVLLALKSPASPLFTQPFIQVQIKENI